MAVSTAIMGNAASAPLGSPNDGLIVPGKRVGRMALGPKGKVVLRRFGKADARDGGMMQTRQAWLSEEGNGSTLYIHTVENGVIDAKPAEGFSIDVVRTSSRRFRTTSGVGVGSTLRQVRRVFDKARRLPGPKGSALYADVRQGIGFEFKGKAANARCVSVTVSEPGKGTVVPSGAVSALIESAAPRKAGR